MFENDALRWMQAAGLVLAYTGGCAWLARRHRRPAAPQPSDAGWLVAHASHSGQAEALARETARALREGGQPATVLPLARLDLSALRAARQLLVVASTHGEGHAPDAALDFELRCMAAASPGVLGGLPYGVLALGDRQYRHFCAFGQRLDRWLREAGGVPLFERIDADRLAPEALSRWWRRIGDLGGAGPAVRPAGASPAGTADDGPGIVDSPFATWRVRRRQLRVEAQAGIGRMVEIELEPSADGVATSWEPGDLAEIDAGDGSPPRSYSIASVPAEGVLRLLVRQRLRPDGREGLVSGWLCGSQVDRFALRLRAHPGFRIGEHAARPLVLIGAGSGWAGLQAHLEARARARGERCWLLYGERSERQGGWATDAARRWSEAGALARADFAWSREGRTPARVPELLRRERERLRVWLDDGAAIFVCGSREGLGAGVDDVLRQVLGDRGVQDLIVAGRLRRDLY